MHGRIGWGQAVCPFYGGCPLFRVSIIRGSTVVQSVSAHPILTTAIVI